MRTASNCNDDWSHTKLVVGFPDIGFGCSRVNSKSSIVVEGGIRLHHEG